MRRLLVIFLMLISSVYAQDKNLSGPLPMDDSIVHGKLENGLTYYIRANSEPQKRAELRLVVNAGSVLENEKQLGLAHFVEHMAFNGSKNFEKQELVNYLESIGMRFGPDINAYTSFDETVYMLQLPTDSMEIFETGFQVLEDWAHLVNFNPEEVDKERGVIIEEWRLRRGASARIRDKQFPVLFHDSRYAERLPIGKKEILESFEVETLRSFYDDWYRPGLIAVVAVGDFDPAKVEALIKTHFSKIEPEPKAPARATYAIPGHDSTLYSIESDPEARFSSVSVYKKIDVDDPNSHKAFREAIVERLYFGMLNNRLNELTQKEDPPYLFASSGKSRFNEQRGFVTMNVVVRDNGIPRGFEALLTETQRLRQHGFTQEEFEREKKSIMRSLEQSLRESDKRKSSRFAAEYIRHFLDGEPAPGLEYEYKLYERFLPTVSLEEVNTLANAWTGSEDRVVLAAVPQKESLELPQKQTLEEIMARVSAQTFAAYADELPDAPLAQTPAKPGKVVKRSYDEDTGITRWTLQNGVEVILKPTDFKNDQILFSASSPGGTSLVSTDSLVSAEMADALVGQSGLGPFTNIQLAKYLSDKVVRVQPYISNLSEGFSGSASPQDLETLLQMVYAYFGDARIDSSSYASMMDRMRGIYENRAADPNSAFSDTLNSILTQDHPRYRNWTKETLNKIDPLAAEHLFEQRFADGDDFTFFMVGTFEPDSIKGMLETWLGALPVQPDAEKWGNETYRYPRGVIRKDVYKGLEEKSQVSLTFTGAMEWSPKNLMIGSWLSEALRIRLREELREDRGGTYGVGVRFSLAHYPVERYRMQISFGSEPQRTDELVEAVFRVADSLKQYGLDDELMAKIHEIKKRSYETNIRENRYWLNQIEFASFHDLPLDYINTIPQRIDAVTSEAVQNTAQKVIDPKNVVRVTLYPEAQAEAAK